MKRNKWLFFALLVVAGVFAFTAGDAAEGEYKLPVKEVVVYPNGFSFLVHEGEVRLRDGGCVLDFLPQALRGSLRVSTPASGVSLEQVRAFSEKTVTKIPLEKKEDFFRENTGKPVQLLLADGEFVSGNIKGFIEPDLLVVTVLHDTGTVDQVYPVDRIAAYYFLNPANLEQEKSEDKRKLLIRLRGGDRNGQYPLVLSYLQTGITWFPEYILDLRSEHEAELIFSAVVKNDLIDLENTTLYLAEEGPRFNGEISPLVVFGEEKDPVYLELTPGGTRAAVKAFAGMEETTLPSLRVYSLPSISLKKGMRVVLPLFHGVIRIDPIYCLDFVQSGHGGGYSNLPVWKGYRLYNESGRRFWLEGQVMITSDNIPLGLRRLPYIPPQSSGEVMVQTDSSIRARVEEEEFERTRRTMLFQGREYIMVKVRGAVILDNYKGETVKISVTQRLSGEVTAAGDQGRITKKAPLANDPNPQSEIFWEVDLPARGEKRLTYVYQVYLPGR
ncbi:MAG: hypothetical protein GX085_01375 [Firmicutes bacterium]|nr:hypothetical protein [Bacillota bacterium]